MRCRSLPAPSLALLATLSLTLLTSIPSLTPSAHACSPPLPGLTGSIPADQTSYAVNATLFFQGYDLGLAGLSVSVENVAESYKLVPADAPWELGLSAKIEPLPPPGHKVTIEGNFCIDQAQCQPSSISFFAAPSDISAPAQVLPVSFDVYDYTDYKSSGGDCTSDSDLAYWLTLDSPAMDPDGSPVYYSVGVFGDPGLQKLVASRSGFASSGEQARVEFRLSASQLGGKSPPEALCFHVKTTDAAGNPAPETSEVPIVVCKPCYARSDDAPNPGFGPPAEPVWGDADAYPGGPCGMGSGAGGNTPDAGGPSGAGGSSSTGSGSGGDDQVIGGCGCRASGQGGSAPALLAGLLLAMVALGRKTRRG